MAGRAGMKARQAGKAALRLPPMSSTSDLVKLYNLQAVKKLSQNFLLDNKLSSKIVSSGCRVRGSHVCEVGPGPGNITRSILEQGAQHLTVIEKDPRFLPALDLLREASQGRLDVNIGNVLVYNMEKLFPPELARPWDDPPPNIYLIGNLPFNIATPLIIRWLRDISLHQNAWVFGRVRMTLTFQLEVVQRMVAPPNHPQRCRLSVMCQNWCHVAHKFTIPGRAFVPKPDVDVGVAHFIPHQEPQIPLPFDLVEKVVRCVFSFRQKYCKRGVANLFPRAIQDAMVAKMMTVADVNPELRSFQLTMPEISRLCHAYSAIVTQNPTIASYNSRESNTRVKEDCDDAEGDRDGYRLR